MKSKSYPAKKNYSPRRQVGTYPVQFLTRYGYLAPVPVNESVSEEELAKAYSLYQEFNGLGKTGTLTTETLRQMELPRCGVPDRFGRKSERILHMNADAALLVEGLLDEIGCPWTGVRELTYAFGSIAWFQISPNYRPPGNLAFIAAVKAAFTTWNAQLQLLNVPLVFLEDNAVATPHIKIEGLFQSNDQHSGHPLTPADVAHADFPLECGELPLPKPIHFETKSTKWSIPLNQYCYDVQSVALHEIGHILGLSHTSLKSDVMYSTPDKNDQKQLLTTNDIAQLRLLYP